MMVDKMGSENGALLDQLRNSRETKGEIAKGIRDKEIRLSTQYAIELGKQKDEVYREKAESKAIHFMATNVRKKFHRESEGMNTLIHNTDSRFNQLVSQLNPREQITAVNQLMNQLKSQFKHETDTTLALEDQAADRASTLSQFVSVMADQNIKALSTIEPEIEKTAELTEAKLGSEDHEEDFMEDEIEGYLHDIVHLVDDLKTAILGRGSAVLTHLQVMEANVGGLMQDHAYWEKTGVENLTNTLAETASLSQEVANIVNFDMKPRTERNRDNAAKEFEDLGFALNMGRVNQNVNWTMTREDDLKQKLATKETEIKAKIKEIAVGTNHKLMALYDDTKKMIDAVNADARLTREEQLARIAKVKAAAKESTQKLLQEAQGTWLAQKQLLSGIGFQGQELELLLGRARRLAAGQFSKLHEIPYEAMKAQIRTGLEQVEHYANKSVDAVSKESLLQELSSDTDSLLEQRDGSPTANLESAVSSVQSLSASLSDEDEGWEKDLEYLGGVMPTVL